MKVLPSKSGVYSQWNGIQSGTPHTPLWELVSDITPDGDVSYVYTNNPNKIFTVGLEPTTGEYWPKAVRISSITFSVNIRTTGTSSKYKLVLYALEQEFKTDVQTITNNIYERKFHTFTFFPNGTAWNVPTINHTEVGLEFIEGDELRCTQIEVFVHTEPYPHFVLSPNASGTLSQWTVFPSTSSDYAVVSGTYDGDLSYIESTTPGDEHTLAIEPMDTSPTPPVIKKVSTKALVKNNGTSSAYVALITRSGGTNFYGGTSTSGQIVVNDQKWHLITEYYNTEPSSGWPSGVPSGSAWTPTDVNSLEIGAKNIDGNNVRITSLAAEVWLEHSTLSSVLHYPSSDGYFQDWDNVIPSTPAWGTVDEDPPDDSTSYITLDAVSNGIARYASFGITAGSFPANHLLYNCKLTYRIRSSSALIAPIVYDPTGGDLYIGEIKTINNTGTTWFDVVYDYYNNPLWSVPWSYIDLTSLEYGLVCIEGNVDISRIEIAAQSVPDLTGTPDPNSATITNYASNLMTRSISDGTIYAVTEFAIGTTGYNTADPKQVIAANPADTALGAELYRNKISDIRYDADAKPWTCTYLCRVPRNVAKDAIGELGLFAEILWSPFPTEIGTKFLFALVHHPCIIRHDNNVFVYEVTITYP